MKKLTILLVIIFSFLFSTTSWGDWNYVVENKSGSKFYYDKDRVRKSGKFIYFWELQDYIKPSEMGDLSYTGYTELDCSIFRFKTLKFQTYNKSMGEGEQTSEFTPKDEWDYPSPGSTFEFFYKKICDEHIGNKGKKRQKGILFLREVNGKWYWSKSGDEDKDKKYVGEIENGTPNGKGSVTYPSGNKYVGEFKDGKEHGQGTFTLSDGSRYVGEWKDGIQHGQGTINSSEGHKYVGEFKTGIQHGQGTLTYPDGTKYVGEFKDGIEHGQGKITWSDGRKYVGEFKDGNQNGQGTGTTPNGNKYEGEWKDKKLWNGTEYDKNRNIIGKYVNGVKQK